MHQRPERIEAQHTGREHWQLRALDALALTYPGAEEDVSQESFDMGYGTIKKDEATGCPVAELENRDRIIAVKTTELIKFRELSGQFSPQVIDAIRMVVWRKTTPQSSALT